MVGSLLKCNALTEAELKIEACVNIKNLQIIIIDINCLMY